MRRAVFLDKDGTLIENVPYNVDPAQIRLAPDAIEGLQLLRDLRYRLIVISNQSGVARGYFEEEALNGVEQRLRELLGEFRIPLHGFYYCPHHPEGIVKQYAVQCNCRKPAPGLLERAARELKIDLARSWFIGDILDDVEAGRRVGCRTLLLDNGNETEWIVTKERRPHYLTRTVNEAAQRILEADLEEQGFVWDRPVGSVRCSASRETQQVLHGSLK